MGYCYPAIITKLFSTLFGVVVWIYCTFTVHHLYIFALVRCCPNQSNSFSRKCGCRVNKFSFQGMGLQCTSTVLGTVTECQIAVEAPWKLEHSEKFYFYHYEYLQCSLLLKSDVADIRVIIFAVNADVPWILGHGEKLYFCHWKYLQCSVLL